MPRFRLAKSIGLMIMFSAGVVSTSIRVLDAISRIQTVYAIKQFLDVFTLQVSVACVFLGPLIVWIAVTHQHRKSLRSHNELVARLETERGPTLWTPGASWGPYETPPPPDPLPPPRVDWYWWKVILWSGSLGLCVALIIGIIYHQPKKVTAPVAPIAPERKPEHKDSSKTEGPKSKVPGRIAQPKSDPPVLPQAPNYSPEPEHGMTSGLTFAERMKVLETAYALRDDMTQALKGFDTVTFLMSWPDGDITYFPFISSLISSGCRTSPRQCWFTQKGGEHDLDGVLIPQPTRAGITIHAKSPGLIANALSRLFVTYTTSSVPTELNGFKDANTKDLVWIEIGPDSPWK